MLRHLTKGAALGALAVGLVAGATPAKAVFWIEAAAITTIAGSPAPVTRFLAPEVFVVNDMANIGTGTIDGPFGDTQVDAPGQMNMSLTFTLGGYRVTTFTTTTNSPGVNAGSAPIALFNSNVTVETIAFGNPGHEPVPGLRGLALRLFDDSFLQPNPASGYQSTFTYNSIASDSMTQYRQIMYDSLGQTGPVLPDGGTLPLPGAPFLGQLDLLSTGTATEFPDMDSDSGPFPVPASGRYALLHEYLITFDADLLDTANFNMVTVVTAPEPAALGLFGMGLVGLAVATRRRKQRAAA